MPEFDQDRIYLDYNASAPIDPAVAEVMRQYLEAAYGNPSSAHWAAEPARAAVERARAQVAALLGCLPGEIVFTSGGSESDNLAIKGVLGNRHAAHIITTAIEHPAIMEPCRYLEGQGVRVTWLGVDHTGQVNPDDLRAAICADTALVSIMHANGEAGTVQPIAECAQIARERGIPFHTDAAQSVGRIPVKVNELGVDLLSIAGHKIYAPKGIGALYVRNGIELEPLVHGAGHEGGRRAGTESAMLTAAFGKACELASNLSGVPQIRALTDHFWSLLQAALGERVVLNGHPQERLPNTLYLSFLGHSSGEILAAVPGIAASTGSACHTGSTEMSPVLKAMGVSCERGAGAIRFSLGRFTTKTEVERAAKLIVNALDSL
jgi:cysteine desulfurase